MNSCFISIYKQFPTIIKITVKSLFFIYILALVLLFSTYNVSHSIEVIEKARKPIIISADVATGIRGGRSSNFSDIDDGWAIGMALNDQTIDVRGIVVTYGNNILGPEMIVTKKIVHNLLGHSKVPVLRGAAKSLPKIPLNWYDDKPLIDACINEGVEFMAGLLAKKPTQTLTIIAIGPLTDIACLVKNFPAEAEKINELVVLMGREPYQEFLIGQKAGLVDFNHVQDDMAIGIILEQSTIRVTFITFSLSSGILVTRDELNTYSNDSREIARFFYGSAIKWIDQWNRWGFEENGFHPWDSHAIYYAAHPEAFECKEVEFVALVNCPSEPNHNDSDNPCASHGPNQDVALNNEASQIWLGSYEFYASLKSKQYAEQVTRYRKCKACTGYANLNRKEKFRQAIFDFLK